MVYNNGGNSRCLSSSISIFISDNMKTAINLTILFSLASTVSCQGAAGYGSYVDPATQSAKEKPHLQLYASKSNYSD